MDRFVETVGRGDRHAAPTTARARAWSWATTTATPSPALWNYAQHFAMSDNSYGTTFGPSTPGALNLVSGQTHGFTTDGDRGAGQQRHRDRRPAAHRRQVRHPRHAARRPTPTNKNVGDLLNAKDVSWGWFQGGFARLRGHRTPTSAGSASKDYIPHHEPFQYYASTANPQHTPPASVAEIGHDGPANHQYDLTDFWAAVNAGNMPAVSFLKAAGLPGRPRRLLQPAGRAALPGRHDQPAAEDAGLEETPRSSSPTTTATAGTTTRWARS